MVAAILLHYVIDDPLPTHGTFGDPGSNPGADNFFFFFGFECFSFFPHFFPHGFSTWYVRSRLDNIQKKNYCWTC